jgi:transcriptional regulator with XRE-family HTH domain
MTVAAEIVRRRCERRWTQAHLAAASGLPVSIIASIEAGDERALSLRALIRCAAALDVEVRALLPGESALARATMRTQRDGSA